MSLKKELKWPCDEQANELEKILERETRAASETEPFVFVRAWSSWVIRPFRNQTGTRSRKIIIRLCLLVCGKEIQ